MATQLGLVGGCPARSSGWLPILATQLGVSVLEGNAGSTQSTMNGCELRNADMNKRSKTHPKPVLTKSSRRILIPSQTNRYEGGPRAVHTHTHTHAHAHTHAQTHAHAHTHAHTHAYTHAQSYSHTHKCMCTHNIIETGVS